MGGTGRAGIACGAVAGTAMMTPVAMAEVGEHYAAIAPVAAAQIATAVIVTALVTALVAPVLTGWVDRRLREKGDPRLEAQDSAARGRVSWGPSGRESLLRVATFLLARAFSPWHTIRSCGRETMQVASRPRRSGSERMAPPERRPRAAVWSDKGSALAAHVSSRRQPASDRSCVTCAAPVFYVAGRQGRPNAARRKRRRKGRCVR